MQNKFKLVVGTKIEYTKESVNDNYNHCTISAIHSNKIVFSDGGETCLDFMNKALKENNCYYKIDDVLATSISTFLI